MPVCVALLRAWRACAGHWAGAAVPARMAAAAFIAAFVAVCAAAIDQAHAKPVRAELSTNIADGYARLVLQFSEEVEAGARLANNIIIVSFKAPVAVSVDRLSEVLPGIVTAARRDPDGRGLRIALAQKVKMNAMQAGERLFIDLMPDSWTGPPPGLPSEVVEDLARRAREAETKLRKQQMLARQRQLPLIRVRVGNQPTFSRYIFDLGELIPVAASREKDTLTLVFDAPLKFDLADVKVAPPPMVESIDAEVREQSTTVRFNFIGNVDVRTFREDQSFVVDVGIVETPKQKSSEREPERAYGTARGHEATSQPGAETAAKRQNGDGRAERPQSAPALDATAPAGEKPPAVHYPVLATAPAAATAERPVIVPPPASPPAHVSQHAAAAPPAAAHAAQQPAAAPPPATGSEPAVKFPLPQPFAPLPPIAAPPPMLPVPLLPGMLASASPPLSASAPPAPAATAPSSTVAQPPAAEPVPPGDPEASAPASPPSVVAAPEVSPTAQAPVQPQPVASLPAVAEQPAALPGLVMADLDLPPGYVSPGAAPSKPLTGKPAASADMPPSKPEPMQAQPVSDSPVRGKVSVSRHGDDLVIKFRFAAPTPAAVFQRADTVWVVFDTATKPDLAPLDDDATHTIRSARLVSLPMGQAVGLKLERPRLTTVRLDEHAIVVTIGDSTEEASRPLAIMRNTHVANHASAAIPFDGARTVHRLADPEVGDTLLVITALGPPRGFLRSQDLIDFRILPSSHGVAIRPNADDLTADLLPENIVLARPNGLAVSTGEAAVYRSGAFRPALFDPQLWGFDREAAFGERHGKLISAAAEAPDNKRTAPRLELARFYLARSMYPETKGVLDVALGEERPTEDPTGLVMRAFANIMIGHIDDALKDLAHPIVGTQHDSQIWRAFAFARQGNWNEAHQHFRNIEAAMSGLPIELQRLVLKEAVRAAIEVRDFAAAASQMHVFETLGVTKEMEAEMAVLAGRVAEGLGRSGDALVNYRQAAGSAVRPAAAQGRLRETALRYHLGDLKRSEVIADLEELTTIWRGDETEIEALQILARLYTEDARYRDAFHVMRAALMAHPNSDMTRRIQEEASKTFDSLFLAGSSDAMPVIDALGLFYDFRELTPIGRRGDEMIRRLSDRLVSVDLLDQAAELLQHQVDHRLQGAARAQVAIRLAVIYLMNHKPDRALMTLHATKGSNVATELRRQRLLLEARALSDIGRSELALEVIANIETREAMRLRADILWAAKRWRESAEQIELLFGDRWRDWQPLTDAERSDILRAAVGYALAQDKLGLERFRERFAAKMTSTPERHAFEVATNPLAAGSAEFAALARAIASGNTLDSFLRDMRARYPETGAFSTRSTHQQQSRAPLADPAPTAAIAPRLARDPAVGRKQAVQQAAAADD